MRACVRVCVWSQFPPSAALPNWGTERPSPCPASLPSRPPAPPPPRGLRASGRPVQSSDSQVQVRRARRASQRSRFTLPPPPRPSLLAPCGPPTRRSLLEFTGCGSAHPRSRDALCRLTGTPLVCSPRLFLSFDRVFTVTRYPPVTQTWPLFAGGCCCPSLAL